MNIEFARDSRNRIVGHIIRQPNTRYEIKSVRFLDENEGQGRTLVTCVGPHVLDFRLAWPYGTTGQTRFDNGVTHSGIQHDHVLGADTRFYLPNLGPMAVYVDGGNGTPDSDILGSIGLVDGSHCVYVVEFGVRQQQENVVVVPDNNSLHTAGVLRNHEERIAKLEKSLQELVRGYIGEI